VAINLNLTAWQAINNWLELYKGLFSGVRPSDTVTGEGAASARGESSDAPPTLPCKKDGSVSDYQLFVNCLSIVYELLANCLSTA
jgi:hypothetical protein